MSKQESEKVDVPSTDELFGSAEFEDKEDIRDHDDRTDRYNEPEG